MLFRDINLTTRKMSKENDLIGLPACLGRECKLRELGVEEFVQEDKTKAGGFSSQAHLYF